MTRRGVFGLRPGTAAVLALILAACGGGGSGGGSGGSSTGSNGSNGSNGAGITAPPGILEAGAAAQTAPYGLDLSAVTLASDTAPSMDRVAVEGLPDDVSVTNLYAEYEVTANDILTEAIEDPADARRVLPLVRIGATAYLLTPLIDPDGSDIILAITDGNSSSRVLELELEALPPPASGALDDLATALEALLASATTALGKDYPGEWEKWRDEGLAQMPAHLAPLFHAWHGFFDGENEHAWIHQQRDSETQTLLERIHAQHAFSAVADGHRAWIDGGDSGYDIAAGTLAVMSGIDSPLTTRQITRHGGTSPTTANLHDPAPAPDSFWELDGLFPIDNAPGLAEEIERYRETRRFERDAELFNDTVGAYLGAVAMIGGGPITGRAMSLARRKALEEVSNIAGMLSNISQMGQWFLPCCIAQMDIELDPDDGVIRHEDEAANQVRIVNAVARAESRPVNITREILGRITKRLSSLLGSALEDIPGTDADDFVDAIMNGTVEELYGEVLKTQISDYASLSGIIEGNLQQLVVDGYMKFVWDDIDMMAGEPQKWLRAEPDTFAAAGSPIIVQASTPPSEYEFRLTTPEAFLRQDSLLRIRPEPDEFGTHEAGETRRIELEYIEVDFTPSRITLTDDDFADPDREIPFRVEVRNSILDESDDPFIDLPLDMEPGLGFITEEGQNPAGTHEFLFMPPDITDMSEDDIIVISTEFIGDSGIRGAADAPPRRGALVIGRTAPAVRVAPHFACLEAGETLQFEAFDPLSGQATEVDWSVSPGTAGSISPGGLFTAGSSNVDEVTITAAAVDSQQSHAVTILVGTCACFWNASLSSTPRAEYGYGGRSATMALVFDEEAGTYTRLQMFDEDGSGDTSLMFNLDPPLPIGASGPTATNATATFPRRVDGQFFELGDTVFDPDIPILPPLELVIDERRPLTVADFMPSEEELEAFDPADYGLPDDWEFDPDDLGVEPEAVMMSGSIRGSVYHTGALGISDSPDIVRLSVAFNGIFSFRPLQFPQMNCEAID